MQLFDSHCHFDFSDFDDDRKPLSRAARELGIDSIFIPGIDNTQWEKAAQLCAEQKGFYFGLGRHPWFLEKPDASEFGAKILCDAFDRFVRSGFPCVAVGECGLDKHRGASLDFQREVLQEHLAAACTLGKPVVLHCVGAHNAMLECLNKTPVPSGVLHAFSGSEPLAQEYIRRGFMIGVGGTITYARAKKTRSAVAHIPLNSIVLETDAPSMPLASFQGQRNTPLQLAEVCKTLAELRGESMELIAEVTYQNSLRLFQLS